MERRRSSVATAFLSILGLGGLAVALVAIAVGFSAAAAQRIETATTETRAIELLEQRQAVTDLFANEQAAAVLDTIDVDTMDTSPVTAVRLTTVENAMAILESLANEGGSVGNEAQRLLAALEIAPEPSDRDNRFERLVAYDEALTSACCSGIVASDKHHTDTVRMLESVASASITPWDYFYVAAELNSRKPPGIPLEVDRFLTRLGTATRLPPDTPLPSEMMADGDMAALASLGVSRESINTVLAGEPLRTLDEIVLNASGRGGTGLSIHEAYAAADAVHLSMKQLFAAALENTRADLSREIDNGNQIRLITNVVTPILLLVLIGIGIAVYRAAQRREQALQYQQQLVDARNRFMRMVSHELRTPATAISGFSQMLSTDWTSLTDTEISEFLRIIDRQSTHLSLIVDDLLTLSHLETGRLRLHLVVVNLAEAAAEAIAMVAGRYDIEVESTVDPEITLIADRERLIQILRNLVENAAKYGKTDVAVSAAPVNGSCEILVSDSGPGVPPEAAETIFRFWNRGGRDGDRVRGHGMGLAIARHLARAMVGDLYYRPHEPVGAEFVLTLPFATKQQETRTDATKAESATIS